MSWFLYLIECADDSVYTGITTDVAARFDEHASGKGARYTRSRKPRAVLASFPLPDRSSASRAEYWVKRLTPAKKRELAAGLRTLESVLPAAVALDERGDTAGTKATARGRKKEPTENTDDAAKTAATEQVAGKKPKAGKVAGSATAATTAKPAKGTPASKSKSTQSNQAAPDAKRAKPDGNAAAKKTSSRGSPVKKTGSPSSASSKRKVPATAGKPTASVRDEAASAPATPPLPASPPARRKTARAKQNRAAS
ncbi:GIY-YIG nuclease family protein [Burkholderia cenocepacia]|uniref:GIY-YIG nuclease family protein n=1 Tax=Burkholderia cenocepacia TaxID=95486 RepID=UPI0009E12DE6|nr:GIY-YIG nuclease family protein [Burkholderia cenocepacia]ARF85686.1 ribonuclease E [Burkholderia cenocepacia]MCW3672855.1 GIY-YIG nuclease family protein [Burkholderia cenocepacia]MDC6086442.1 GIY-YIG nuclease family protein [Burkholderia cenocepacia]MEB2600698.1 GIY-YIG nuclease family protein [Burkholderia cenocepacia]